MQIDICFCFATLFDNISVSKFGAQNLALFYSKTFRSHDCFVVQIAPYYIVQDECEIEPDLLSIESTVSGSHLRNNPIVCSYMANINACDGAALKAVIPHPRYNPATPSLLYTSINTSANLLDA
mmetsp:Transcript_1861/g.4247  ORF Transcript_1861/g.4247 Transcript_1861/m.4247 type:complete len:124 (-) Transcript_1861:1010-1381(-)